MSKKNINIEIHSYQSDDFHLEYFMNREEERPTLQEDERPTLQEDERPTLQEEERPTPREEETTPREEEEKVSEDDFDDRKNHLFNEYNQDHTKKVFCSNCGKCGHSYKKCNYPITSIGIICVSFAQVYFNDMIYYLKKFQNQLESGESGERDIFLTPEEITKLQRIYENIKTIDENSYDKWIKYLMIQRKCSLCFIEFIRGKYDLDNIDYIFNILQLMTNEERGFLLTKSFEELWSLIWYHNKSGEEENSETLFQSRFRDFQIAKNKFELMKSGFFVKKNEIQMEYSIVKMIRMIQLQHRIRFQYDNPEWGFPKGRRNYKEKNIFCAKREFQEETNLRESDYQITNLSPVEEVFFGINSVRYKHIYYIAQACRKIELVIDRNNQFQTIEIGNIQWLTIYQALECIREYNIEKRNMMINTHIHLKSIFFLFQKMLREIIQKLTL